MSRSLGEWACQCVVVWLRGCACRVCRRVCGRDMISWSQLLSSSPPKEKRKKSCAGAGMARQANNKYLDCETRRTDGQASRSATVSVVLAVAAVKADGKVGGPACSAALAAALILSFLLSSSLSLSLSLTHTHTHTHLHTYKQLSLTSHYIIAAARRPVLHPALYLYLISLRAVIHRAACPDSAIPVTPASPQSQLLR